MLKEYMRILKQHSDDVFGIRSKLSLSIFTVLAILCVVVPILFFLTLTILKFLGVTPFQ